MYPGAERLKTKICESRLAVLPFEFPELGKPFLLFHLHLSYLLFILLQIFEAKSQLMTICIYFLSGLFFIANKGGSYGWANTKTVNCFLNNKQFFHVKDKYGVF